MSADREHPERKLFERFVRGETSRPESMAVVLHLLHGCAECQQAACAVWYRTEAPRARMALGTPRRAANGLAMRNRAPRP